MLLHGAGLAGVFSREVRQEEREVIPYFIPQESLEMFYFSMQPIQCFLFRCRGLLWARTPSKKTPPPRTLRWGYA